MTFQIKKNAEVFDACIVGSGAGGGMAAKILAEAGFNIALLEAGPDFDAARATMFAWPYDSSRREANTYRPFGEYDAAFGGWEISGEPYTHSPGTSFDWFRSRMLGGRTNHWGRISLRFGPRDFRHKSKDGLGENWPISYDDIKPYYDKIDKLIGVFGTNEGLENDPDGYFMPPPRPRAHELLLKQACDKINIPVYPSRMSIITKPLNERPPCHYCSQCNRGCSTYSNFSSPSVLIRPAMGTGKISLVTGAMAREILTDRNGKASGVSYVDTNSLNEVTIKARTVILGASACESARLLLNSKSALFPDGLANSSGVVGHYLHDSTGTSRSAFIPKLLDRQRYDEDGIGGMHVYIPWWLDNTKLDFPRGYHIEMGGGMNMPSYGFGYTTSRINNLIPDLNGNKRHRGSGGYGKQLKNDYRRFYGSYFHLSGRGESIARYDNYCEIDPDVVDKYGIPVLRFHYTWSDHEIKQTKHMQDTFEEIFLAMGGVPLGDKPGPDINYGLENPGRIIHEVGTVRMGENPANSALNKFCQSHEVKNLFVVDGAPFVSQADKNPTWTILALAMRTSEYIIDQAKQQNF